jgi:hypothetical protein
MKWSRRFKSASTLAWLGLALLGSGGALADETGTSTGLDYQIHGFASLGYIKTSGNNFYGESKDGSFDYYEVGLNGIIQINPQFSASGQLLAREAGETDDGDIRVDYAYLDYQLITMEAARAGARLGRVRNPLGFYNESRDVLFTRPSILLPQSVYLEGTGVRELLFSSDGLQLYSDWDHDQHHTGLKLNIAKSTEVSDTTRSNFNALGPGLSVDEMTLKDPIYLQILHERDGGQLRLAASFLSATLEATISPAPGFSVPASIDAEIMILSAQYNMALWSLTSEYSLTSSDISLMGTRSDSRGDGAYLQGEYRFTPELTGLLRYDVTYSDRSNRGNSDSRDTTLGFGWKFRPSWILAGEFHNIDGTAGIPRIDNQGRVLEPRTKLLTFMLGYRF